MNGYEWADDIYSPIPNNNGDVRLGNFIPGENGEPIRLNIYYRVKDFFFRKRRVDFIEYEITFNSPVIMNDVCFNAPSGRYTQPVKLIKGNMWRCVSWRIAPSRWETLIVWLRLKFRFIDRHYTTKEG